MLQTLDAAMCERFSTMAKKTVRRRDVLKTAAGMAIATALGPKLMGQTRPADVVLRNGRACLTHQLRAQC